MPSVILSIFGYCIIALTLSIGLYVLGEAGSMADRSTVMLSIGLTGLGVLFGLVVGCLFLAIADALRHLAAIQKAVERLPPAPRVHDQL